MPVRTRWLRFVPGSWNNHIGMRVELYGCWGDTRYVLTCCRRTSYYKNCEICEVSKMTSNGFSRLNLEIAICVFWYQFLKCLKWIFYIFPSSFCFTVCWYCKEKLDVDHLNYGMLFCFIQERLAFPGCTAKGAHLDTWHFWRRLQNLKNREYRIC